MNLRRVGSRSLMLLSIPSPAETLKCADFVGALVIDHHLDVAADFIEHAFRKAAG